MEQPMSAPPPLAKRRRPASPVTVTPVDVKMERVNNAVTTNRNECDKCKLVMSTAELAKHMSRHERTQDMTIECVGVGFVDETVKILFN